MFKRNGKRNKVGRKRQSSRCKRELRVLLFSIMKAARKTEKKEKQHKKTKKLKGLLNKVQ